LPGTWTVLYELALVHFHHGFTLSVKWDEKEQAEKPETGGATIN
jgi:hypothetical protein